MEGDLVLRNGLLVDPSQGLCERRDIVLRDGKVFAVGQRLEADANAEVFELHGRIVTPGLIDLHVHVYAGVSHYGVLVDPSCLQAGSTTVVDAGSSGAQTFPGFRRYIIDVFVTRVLALLNVSSQGMLTPEVGELEELRYADVKRAVRVCEENRDVILGIKVRLTPALVGENGREALLRAVEAAQATGLPLMVHPNEADMPLGDILSELREGDILTHCFHGRSNGILDERERVKPGVRKAAERGIFFDVGHGRGSFSFDVARKSLAQEFYPATISSDLHRYNIEGPVHSLAATASKFLHLGFSLEEVVARITQVPAMLIGYGGVLGCLQPGACADVAVFDLREGRFELQDCEGEIVTADRELVPVMVIKGGQIALNRLG